MKRGLPFGIAICVLAAVAPGASASTITVDTTSDGTAAGHCTLNDAIDSANSNATVPTSNCAAGDSSGVDSIVFGVAVTGAINLDASLPGIATPMSISGPGSTVLDVHAKPACACVVFSATGGPFSISGLKVTGARVVNAGALGGGGLSVGAAVTGTVDSVTLDDNIVEFDGFPACGGAILNNGSLTLTRSTVSNNRIVQTGQSETSASGGGICNRGTLVADSDTVNGNVAHADSGTAHTTAAGGGIVNAGTATVERTTINNNTVEVTSGTGQSRFGGGIAQLSAGSLALTSDTIATNSAEDLHGHTIYAGGQVTIRNTILAIPGGITIAGVTSLNCVVDPGGQIASLGYNLESGTTCGLNSSGDQHDTLPLLMAIGQNGGPTRTRLLQPTSPAIDAGNSFGETTDQRGAGFPRPLDFPAIPTGPGDGADIGAVEMPGDPFSQPPPPPPPPPPTAPVAIRTGLRPAALKKCKKKRGAKRKKCKRRARKLPL